MKKLTILYAFIICTLGIYGSNNSYSSEAYKGIKMGFEVEVISPIKYQAREGEKGLRHKRLLVAKNITDDSILWRLEVDSSNKDIEFVSVPFSLPAEFPKLQKASQTITAFLHKINTHLITLKQAAHDQREHLSSSKDPIFLDKVDSKFKRIVINHDFLTELNQTLLEMGVSLELDTNLTEEIVLRITAHSDIGLSIQTRPQVTYQFPLLYVSRLFEFFKNKEGFFDSNEEKARLTQNIKAERTSLDGLVNLIHYYLNNLSFLQENVRKIAKSPNKRETGLKQFFPFMSRLAFSDMSQLVSQNKEEQLAKLQTEFSGVLEHLLLPIDYPLLKNPLYTEAQGKTKAGPLGYPYRLLYTDLVRGDQNISFTVNNWLASIVDPTTHKRPFLLKSLFGQPRKDEIKAKIAHAYKIVQGLGKEDSGYPALIQSNLKKYLKDMSSNEGAELHQWKDLLSPPPYSPFLDSMGTLADKKRKPGGAISLDKELGIDKEYGEAVLEIRRYSKYYISKKVTHTDENSGWQPLESFLQEEATGLLEALN